MQDTVVYSYGQHPKTKGLGPIGKSNSAHEPGLCVHNALAFTTSGMSLGMLSQNIWARQPVPEEEHQEKAGRLHVTPIEEKESFKWLQAMRETRALAVPLVELHHHRLFAQLRKQNRLSCGIFCHAGVFRVTETLVVKPFLSQQRLLLSAFYAASRIFRVTLDLLQQ